MDRLQEVWAFSILLIMALEMPTAVGRVGHGEALLLPQLAHVVADRGLDLELVDGLRAGSRSRAVPDLLRSSGT